MIPRTPESILASMTRAQKLAQLQIIWRRELDDAGAVARGGIGALFWPGSAADTNELQRIAREESPHGIPLLIGLDILHGQFTIFPTPLAQAASFDLDVARIDARTSAAEARASGVSWTFSPMIDVTRDPRWGRVVEGFGEDAFLTSAFGVAKVLAYQGANGRDLDGIVACLKHFVAYGAAEGGRDYNTTDLSVRRLRDVYLEPFRAGVAAGAATVMAAFNSLNGRPMHANEALLRGVLAGEWGFDGVVVGDADGVSQLVQHGIAADEADADTRAITSGIDMVMGGELLPALATTATISVDPVRLDDAVLRILRLKDRLGLFENSTVDAGDAPTAPTTRTRADARWAAERCAVLVKNETTTLPIGPDVRRILLVGPYARSTDHLGAWVQHFAAPATSLELALAGELPEIEWVIRDGSGFLDGSDEDRADAARAAADADLVILAIGEPSSLSGEAASRSDIRLPDAQAQLADAILSAGVPVAVVLMTGRPLVLGSWFDRADAVLIAWHLGTEGPAAIARLLAGRVDPAGRLPMSFPRSVGQIPVHHDHEPTGRPARRRGHLSEVREDVALAGPGNLDDHYTSKYLDLDLGPRLPFGHGFGYTSFAFGATEVSPPMMGVDELVAGTTVTVSTLVTNTGERDGDDVVLLLLSDPLATLSQPVQRLVGFQRVSIPAGASTPVTFRLDARSFGFWTDEATFVIERGDFHLRLSDGSSSASVSLTLN